MLHESHSNESSQYNTLQQTATNCNKLQHTATRCNTLQHTAPYCNALQCSVKMLHESHSIESTHCNTLQHTATHCNTLQHSAAHCSTLQHTAAHCSTLQHTAAHCNTLPRNMHMLKSRTVNTSCHRSLQECKCPEMMQKKQSGKPKYFPARVPGYSGTLAETAHI